MDLERPSFESKWPELAARVEASLRRRNVPSWLRDDVVQETGLRLFKMWDNVDPERSPSGLALTIANNVLWDAVARHRNREVLGDVPDAPAEHDVERLGIARLELARVSRGMQDLSPAHRSILLAEIDENVPRPASSPAAVKMLRMRARRRLSALLEHASAVGLFVGLRKRALRFRMLVERTALYGDGAAAAVSGLVATVTIITGVAVVAQAATPVELGRVDIARVRASAASRQVRVAQPLALAERARIERRAMGRDATPSSEEESQAQRYEVPFGGGPVNGGATVEVRDNGEEGIVLVAPTCGVERPSESEYVVSCTDGQVNSTEIDIAVEVKARP